MIKITVFWNGFNYVRRILYSILWDMRLNEMRRERSKYSEIINGLYCAFVVWWYDSERISRQWHKPQPVSHRYSSHQSVLPEDHTCVPTWSGSRAIVSSLRPKVSQLHPYSNLDQINWLTIEIQDFAVQHQSSRLYGWELCTYRLKLLWRRPWTACAVVFQEEGKYLKTRQNRNMVWYPTMPHMKVGVMNLLLVRTSRPPSLVLL